MSALHPVVVTGLSVTFRDRTALSGVDLLAQPGRRIGLVGENGTGKSTLLRAVAGRLPEHARVAGTIEAPSDVVLLGQEPPFRDDRTIGAVLAATLRPLRDAVLRVEELAGDLHDEAEPRRRTPQLSSTRSTTTPGTPTVVPRSPPRSSDSARSTPTGRSARCRVASARGWRSRP